MQVELQTIKEQVTLVANRLLEVANLREGDVFVLGCSSSEICGGQIGKASSAEVGQTVIEALLPILKEKGLYLAVQGCEHINRALVIERAAAEKSFVESPVFGIMSHEKRKGSVPPGWSWPCKSSSRSSPVRERDLTPSFLKLPQISASTRSSLARAEERLSAFTPKVTSFVRTMPLLLLAI